MWYNWFKISALILWLFSCSGDNDYGGNNEDDDGSDYDSFYDPYYDSQSEDGGAMSRLSHRETFGNGLGSDLGDDNISISSDGISGMIDSLSAEVSANSGSGSGHSHSFFGSVKSAVSSRSGQSRGSQTWWFIMCIN